MKKGKTKLYNVLFPVWMLMMFPGMWLIILPGNFIIDSLVLLITMKILNYADKKMFYKKHILMIFIFNYFITFKKLDKKERLRLSLIFAIITAPYTYLIPTSWIYY